MVSIPTLYDVLKVSRDAPPEVIRASYKALSQKHHPDRNPGDARASAAMQQINQAYAILSVPEKRRQHDRWLAQREREASKPAPGPQAQEPTWKTRDGAGKQGSSTPKKPTGAASAQRFCVALFNAIKPFLIFAASLFVFFVVVPALIDLSKKPRSTASPSQRMDAPKTPIAIQCRPVTPGESVAWAAYPAGGLYKCEDSEGQTTYRALPPKGAVVAHASQRSEAVGAGSQQLSNCEVLFTYVDVGPKVSVGSQPGPPSKGRPGAMYKCEEANGKTVYKSEADVQRSRALSSAKPSSEPSAVDGTTKGSTDVPWEQYTPVATNVRDFSAEKSSSRGSLGVYKRPVKAPNGSPWPTTAAYVDGYDKLNAEGYSKVTVDNSKNDSDVFVKLNALNASGKRPIRHIFIPAHQRFTMNKINAGRYDVRYRDLDTGGMQKSEPFELEQTPMEDGIQYSEMSLTLYKVRNGNMETFVIKEQDF